MPAPTYARTQTNGSSTSSAGNRLNSDLPQVSIISTIPASDKPHSDTQLPPDPHSLTRLELISLLEFERRSHPCATFSPNRPNCESILAASQFKDVTIDSLKSQLSECDARATRLEGLVKDLREELSALSKLQSPISSPAMSTLSVTVSSSSSSGRTRAGSEHRDLITRIQSLNTIISAAAAALSRSLSYNDHLITVSDRRTIDGINDCLVRSTWVVGERVASELIAEPLPVREIMTHGSTYAVPQVLAQMVMEMVLAKWAAFVLGWVETGFVAFEPDAHAQWHRIVRRLRSQLEPENKAEWLSSILRSAKDIAYISGWTFKPSSDTNDKNDPSVALSPFIAAVQGLRKALDQIKDNSDTAAEIYLILPGSPFSPSPILMTDGYAVGRRTVFGVRRRPSVNENDSVIGNTGLGLKGPEEKVILPPMVVREKAFLNAFSRSAQVEEPKIRVRVGGGRSGGLVVQSPGKSGSPQ